MSEYDEIAALDPSLRLTTRLLVERAAQAQRIAELEAENARLRAALAEEAHWHDGEVQALGKQPPSIDRSWRMDVHRERRDALCPVAGLPDDGSAWATE